MNMTEKFELDQKVHTDKHERWNLTENTAQDWSAFYKCTQSFLFSVNDDFLHVWRHFDDIFIMAVK